MVIPIHLELCQEDNTYNFKQFTTSIDHAITQGDTTRGFYKSGIVYKGCHTYDKEVCIDHPPKLRLARDSMPCKSDLVVPRCR